MPTLTIEPEALAPLTSADPDRPAPTFFLSILTIALIARCIVLGFVITQSPSAWIYKQSLELSALAQSLLLGQGMSSPFGGHTGPSAFLAPGYPAIVAVIFKLFGSYTQAAAIAIMVFQTILNLATILVIMLLTRRLFGNRAANIAGTIWALSPILLWVPVIFWESSFTNLALISILTFALYIVEKPTITKWIAMGLAAGVILLVNPALVLVLIATLVLTAHRTRTTGRSGPIIATLLCLLVFAPWPIRNARALHAFVHSVPT